MIRVPLMVELSPFFNAGSVRICKSHCGERFILDFYSRLIALRCTVGKLASQLDIECRIKMYRSIDWNIKEFASGFPEKLPVDPLVDQK